MLTRLALALLAAAPLVLMQTPAADPALLQRAKALQKQSPLIDGHNDYPWALRENGKSDLDQLDIAKPQPTLMTDIPRLRAGGLGGQFWSVYVPVELQGQAAVTATLEQIDIVQQMVRKYPETFELALGADDVERIFKKGKIASLIGMEGGHSIDNSLGALRMFYRLGARYMTLTHSKNTAWADSCSDTPASNGLSPFGETGRPGDELARHARRSVPHVARYDGRRHPRQRGAGDLLALLLARHQRRRRGTFPTTSSRSSRKTAAS